MTTQYINLDVDNKVYPFPFAHRRHIVRCNTVERNAARAERHCSVQNPEDDIRVITAEEKKELIHLFRRAMLRTPESANAIPRVIYGRVYRFGCVSPVVSCRSSIFRSSLSLSLACARARVRMYICQNGQAERTAAPAVIFRGEGRLSMGAERLYGLPKKRDLRSEHARIFLALSTSAR